MHPKSCDYFIVYIYLLYLYNRAVNFTNFVFNIKFKWSFKLSQRDWKCVRLVWAVRDSITCYIDK